MDSRRAERLATHLHILAHGGFNDELKNMEDQIAAMKACLEGVEVSESDKVERQFIKGNLIKGKK